MTPAICVAAISFAHCPIVVTHHAHGDLGWMRPAMHFWGFLMDRVDARDRRVADGGRVGCALPARRLSA